MERVGFRRGPAIMEPPMASDDPVLLTVRAVADTFKGVDNSRASKKRAPSASKTPMRTNENVVAAPTRPPEFTHAPMPDVASTSAVVGLALTVMFERVRCAPAPGEKLGVTTSGAHASVENNAVVVGRFETVTRDTEPYAAANPTPQTGVRAPGASVRVTFVS